MKKYLLPKLLLLLIPSLGSLLAGCGRDKDTNIFSQLNGKSIIIKPNNQESMSRQIITDGKTKTNIHNQLSYLESCISKQFHLNVKKNQHIPFQLKNGMQYLDPNKKNNEIKLLSGNGETGVFYVTWKYTLDQKNIFELYHQLQAISAEKREVIIDEKTSDFNPAAPKPIHPSIVQVRNAIQKVAKITDDQKLMINFSKKSDLKLQFNTIQDIFPEIFLSKNNAKYSFRKDGALSEDMIQPKIKVKWYNWHLFLLLLKNKIVNSDDIWWGKTLGFPFDMNVADYADDRRLVRELLFNDIDFIPEDLYQYFSLSHTKLIEKVPSPATLYFNKGNKFKEEVDNIVFNRKIWIRGVYL